MPRYIPYNEDLEQIDPDEPQTFRKIIEVMAAGQHKVRENYGHSVRISHAKAHGFLKGQLIIPNDLPEELAQGLFAQAGSHPVIARLAHAPGEVLDDRKVSAPRGFALKIFEVEGAKLPGHESASTQDFLFNTGKAFIVGDAKAFLAAFTPNATIAPSLPESVKGAVSKLARAANAVIGESSGKLDFYGHPPYHPLGESYYSQVPFRYGNYVAKFSLTPANAALEDLYEQKIDLDNEDSLRTETVNFFRTHAAEFILGAQLATDLEKMPIEDASVEWPEDLSSYRPVARLVLPAQEAYDPNLQDFVDFNLSFSPAHSLLAHRPLGSVMRARLAVYPAIANMRHEENNRRVVEPTSSEQLSEKAA